MRREAGLPGCLRAALERRLDAVVAEDRLDRVTTDVMADMLQPTPNPRVVLTAGRS
jgi:hypothetical protein